MTSDYMKPTTVDTSRTAGETSLSTIDTRHPSREFLLSLDVRELLPQRDPIVMVGHLIGFDEESMTTETHIDERLLFLEDGRLMAEGLMENIAQTCAARIGYYNKYILRDEIRIGYIGAVRSFSLRREPLRGETITTRIHVLEDVFGLTLAEAEVTTSDGGELIATAQMKIALEGAGKEDVGDTRRRTEA